jgi:hypothetical protein
MGLQEDCRARGQQGIMLSLRQRVAVLTMPHAAHPSRLVLAAP